MEPADRLATSGALDAAPAGTLPPPAPVFGRALRPLWPLAQGAAFLNHGSYGAPPRAVAAVQAAHRARMEAAPDAFFADLHRSGSDAPLRRVAAVFAGLWEVPTDSVALVENATAGVSAALASVALAAGDEVLLSDHQYPAVRLAVAALCRRTGAVPRIVSAPLPTTPAAAAERFLDGVGPRTRLAVVDHVASASALRWPVEEMVPLLRARGIATLVDGAHALGHLAAAPGRIGADWYVSNAHKWLYAPRGTAALHASPEAAARLAPLQISHFAEAGFPLAFDCLGTRDATPWLAAPAGVAFAERLGPGVREHCAGLLARGAERLQALGARPLTPPDPDLRLRAFLLPEALAPGPDPAARAAARRAGLLAEGVVVYVQPFLGEVVLRLSGAPYVDAEDVDRLADAIARRAGRRAEV
ncbi:aminotransferase class V-fold PLP-dependent enzyme [uncultured Albimonas sp.]|uniref:aminotransferase class V-fold PLP-dependent enzyme n=1 Tax=uncultured Albimonas sp. TaxID=1331701 RepID=UPI0030EB1F99